MKRMIDANALSIVKFTALINECLGWFWISEQDLAEYYEPIWPPEWVENDS